MLTDMQRQSICIPSTATGGHGVSLTAISLTGNGMKQQFNGNKKRNHIMKKIIFLLFSLFTLNAADIAIVLPPDAVPAEKQQR